MGIDAQQIAKIVERIPAFPESVHRVLELTSSIDTPPKEIVAVIEHDPILTMRLLKTVNSPFFGLSREVTGIKQAVVYVGMNTVKNVAITVATAGALPKTNKAGLDIASVWMHCLRVGVIARIQAKRCGVNANDLASYFVAGLLHDVGKIVFAEYLPDIYKEVLSTFESTERSLVDIEREHIGIDHAELGGLVAKKWKLPADLIQAIELHHALLDPAFEASAEAVGQLALGVSFANCAAHVLEDESQALETLKASARFYRHLPELLLQWVGSDVEPALQALPNLAEEIEKAQTFMMSSSAA